MTESIERVLAALPLLVAIFILFLLAGLLVLFAGLYLLRRRRTEKDKDEAWARMQTVLAAPPADSARTQEDWTPDPNTFGVLTVQSSDDRTMIGKHFPLTKPVTTLGRSRENDIPFPKDSPVSRKHARIEKREAGIYLVEVTSMDVSGQLTRSRYGTFINQDKIEDNGSVLKPGDIIRIGKRVQLRFEPASPEPASGEKTYLAFGNQKEANEQATQPMPVQKGNSPVTKDTDI